MELSAPQRLALSIMDRRCPSWGTIVGSEAYLAWLHAQSDTYQQTLNSTWDYKVVLASIKRFVKAT